MNRSLASRARRVLFAAAGLSALAVVGCSNENQPDQTNPPAIQSSGQNSADSNGSTTTSMAFPTGNRSSSDLLVEEITPREAQVGKPYTYQLRVTNLTDHALAGVVLHQKIPADFVIANGASRGSPGARDVSATSNGQAQFDIGTLGPKQSRTISVTGTPSRTGPIDTCLLAQYNPPTLCAVVNAVAPQIAVAVTGQQEADICQEIVYHYRVTNTGSGTAHNLVLRENLPKGLQTRDGRNAIAVNIGDLGQGQSKDVPVTLRATEAGRFNSRAVVDSDAGQASAQEVTTAVHAPRLAVTIDAPKEEYVGDRVAYKVTVKNNGDAPAQGAKLRFGATPGMVNFVDAQGGKGAQLASEEPNGGQSLGTIAPGQSREVTVDLQAIQGGPVTVKATALAQCAQPVTTPVQTVIKTVSASALVVTHNPDPVRIGTDVTYHIVVENKGNAADHNVVVKAIIPDSEKFVKAKGETEGSAQGQTVTFGAIPTLNAKQSMSWDVTAKALRSDEAQFRVTMTSQTTTKPAEKLEPTKLYGTDTGAQQRTNEAPETPRVNQPAPSTPQDQPLNK